MPLPVVSSLHIHPVKSLGGSSPAQAVVEPWGLAGDRRWMLVDTAGKAVTQRQYARLALASADPLPGPGGGLRVSAPGREPLTVAVPDPGRGTVPVDIFGTKVEAVPAGTGAERDSERDADAAGGPGGEPGVGDAGDPDAWFSAYLDADVRLVHMDDPAHRRPVNPKYARPGDTVNFADGYPLLATTTASLDALNALIARGDHAEEGPLPMERFRPTVVVEGTAPWDEDGWTRLAIGDVTFRAVKQCGRCVVTTTDQRTAVRGKEPLRTLGRHRRFGGKLAFGMLLVPETTGTLRVGDPVEILERREPPTHA
ncbi:MOSC domain-containing protein [Streptomyces sp. TRM64462]|uniref:MOSC domain-containing protein n=1 Tax=Streptomyces sp. TRM64462 TaxID=2741726 RepID=UPI001586EC98|nr:MOSC N-terminal beta barrel domain-containing protein [Streptomyces sp. TRM64462]